MTSKKNRKAQDEVTLTDVILAVANLSTKVTAVTERVDARDKAEAKREVDEHIATGRLKYRPGLRKVYVRLALTDRETLAALLEPGDD